MSFTPTGLKHISYDDLNGSQIKQIPVIPNLGYGEEWKIEDDAMGYGGVESPPGKNILDDQQGKESNY